MQTEIHVAPTTHTPEQVLAAKAAVEQQGIKVTSVLEGTGQVTPDLAKVEEAETGNTVLIQQVAAETLRLMLEKALASNFFMGNPKRIAALESALTIPVSDDKSFQQFYNHAEKDLLAESYRNARRTGGMPTEVTNAQIMAEAQKRYMAKHGKRAVVNEEYEAH